MGNKLKSTAKQTNEEDNKAQTVLDWNSLPALVATTDHLPLSVREQKSKTLSNSAQFEEHLEGIIKQCISSNAKTIELIPGNSYIPLIKFPYTLFKQCSSNLVEVSVSWRPLPLNDSQPIPNDPSTIINTFPSDIFDHLPNLKKLNLARYPFPYLSDKIGKLSNLEHFYCYGSSLMCFPRTMYKLQKLTEIDPYCSYELHYLPYELGHCSLSASRISTGALYNNGKNKQLFPPLPPYPCTFVEEINDFVFNEKQLKTYVFDKKHCVLTDDLNDLVFSFAFDSTFCSKCKCDIMIHYIHYIWVFRRIGTDNVGLLGRMCPNCIEKYVKTKNFIANVKKEATAKDIGGWGPRINWKDDIDYEKELFLYNQKGTITSAKIKYEYGTQGNEFYQIPPIRVSWKYTGFETGDYNMENVSKSWIKFWKFNLFIDFEEYQLCTNVQTKEVNVVFM